jgi:hypothetical protein
VKRIAGAQHEDAIAIWPNPATTEVHIAWRGDLRHMPRHFTVYDMLGRQVAAGDVESWRGEVIWQCGDHASGGYIIKIEDYRRQQIATARVLKE